MIVDFCRTKPPLIPVSIQGEDVEVVHFYKYLRLHLDHRLEWAGNTESQEQRLYFLQRLQHLQQDAVDVLSGCGRHRDLLWVHLKSLMIFPRSSLEPEVIPCCRPSQSSYFCSEEKGARIKEGSLRIRE